MTENDKLYEECVVWLKEILDLTLDDAYWGVINKVQDLKNFRDECLGLFGDTPLVKFMKEEGTFEERKKDWDKYKILTFEEYKESKLNK